MISRYDDEAYQDALAEANASARPKKKKTEVHFYLSPGAAQLLTLIATAQGIGKTAVLELAIRDTARRLKIKPPITEETN